MRLWPQGWRGRPHGPEPKNHRRHPGGVLSDRPDPGVQRPLRLALKLLVNTLLGFLALWVVRLTAGVTGIALGLNLWNALVIGILGLPGFALLLLVQWVL